jgi:hypothetical protein
MCPLARTHKVRTIPATPPHRVETWREDALLLRAEVWADMVRPDAAADAPTITGLALHDPRHREPLLLGVARQFVHAPETGQRQPELARLAGAVLSSAAASAPAIPTGVRDRRPQPTPGRLRRFLARTPLPQDCPLPARRREKASATAHRPKGFWGQWRTPATLATPTTLAEAACVSANGRLDGWHKCSKIEGGTVIASKTCRARTKSLPDPGRRL